MVRQKNAPKNRYNSLKIVVYNPLIIWININYLAPISIQEHIRLIYCTVPINCAIGVYYFHRFYLMQIEINFA